MLSRGLNSPLGLDSPVMDAEEPVILPPAHLYMEDGGNIYRVNVGVDRLKIGSGPDNDIIIRAPDVDEKHGMIEVSGGHYVLTAITQNPAIVNGKLAEGPRRLYNGDVIDLGGQVMTFVKVPAASDTVLQLGIWSAGESPYFVLMNRTEFSVGNQGCDLLLPDDFVASPQCVIENFCAGAIFIVPVSEDRPTLLNGSVITRRTRLNDADVLKMGTTEVAVRLHPKRGLPGPTDLLPLHEVARAQIQGIERPSMGSGAAAASSPPPGRSVKEILDGDHDDGRMRPVSEFDDFDEDDDRRYYLPGYEEERRPSGDGRMDESAGDGHTMVIDVDSAGRRKKDRYYLPEGHGDEGRRARGIADDAAAGRETRDDLPTAEAGVDEDESG